MFKAIAITTTMLISMTGVKETTPETYYPSLAVVTETNTETDCVTIMTVPDGNEWDFYGVEDWSGGDLAVCIFSDKGTPDYLQDDEIITVHYSGYVDGENYTSETGERLEYFSFSGECWNLEEN